MRVFLEFGQSRMLYICLSWPSSFFSSRRHVVDVFFFSDELLNELVALDQGWRDLRIALLEFGEQLLGKGADLHTGLSWSRRLNELFYLHSKVNIFQVVHRRHAALMKLNSLVSVLTHCRSQQFPPQQRTLKILSGD